MKKDCFAFKNKDKGYCSALKEIKCDNCRFYKTKKQYESDLMQLSKNGR